MCYLIASLYCLAMLQLLVLSTILVLVPASPLQGRSGPDQPGDNIGPEPSFQRRWKTKLQNFPLSYGSASLAMHEDTLFVLNGGDVGNYVEKFSPTGNYSGEDAGWYNWPIDLVVGGEGQLLVSALGAMGDDHMMAFGLVMYSKEGRFLHGFHQENTTIGRPFGMATVPGSGSGQVVVADWFLNRTLLVDVDWTKGNISINKTLSSVPYPHGVAVSKDKIAVISMVCCQPWQEPLKAMRLYDRQGKLLKEIKKLPDGSIITAPETVAMDPSGNIYLVDGAGGLNQTMFFDSDGNFIKKIPALGTPSKILVSEGLLFTLEDITVREKEETYVNVFSLK